MKKILLALSMILALLTISAVAENKSVTIPDLSDTISGIYVQKEDHRANGTSYYQYNYKYGSSCYQIMQMVADDMVNTGYYKLVGYSTYGDSSFWQLQYIGPGADELKPLSSSGEKYHVELGCANYSYVTSSSAVFTSIKLCDGISLGETTYAEGAQTNEKKLENVSGFSVKTRTVQRTCTVCHGSGSCHLCNGTGTYRMYGQAIECDKICSFCKGEKTYEVLETYYVPN